MKTFWSVKYCRLGAFFPYHKWFASKEEAYAFAYSGSQAIACDKPVAHHYKKTTSIIAAQKRCHNASY